MQNGKDGLMKKCVCGVVLSKLDVRADLVCACGEVWPAVANLLVVTHDRSTLKSLERT